jgi:hypothetical protein
MIYVFANISREISFPRGVTLFIQGIQYGFTYTIHKSGLQADSATVLTVAGFD